VGIDLDDPAIQAEWAKRQAPNLEYRAMKAENLPFAAGEFDLASAIEVLEHVPDPSTPSPRWRASPSAGCSSPCRASRCGAG
jgi:2-polyprenyl-3-methyl-5-hydroxy-6-metoxy-1,4-benzoquinol methylase